ncbi:MAG TPA: phytoene/squalene synthase family protein [Polyangiaceae bacterium]|nr:phytoene/squalene synthase family protein [Polyangiaceae bacterium]
MTSQPLPAAVAPLAPAEARAVIKKHSKSFALASVLLGPGLRDDASGLYAYCRRADDAVDLVAPELAGARVDQLRAELDDVYAGRSLSDPVLVEFQRLVFDKRIPRAYPQALLEGFEQDAAGQRYQTLRDLYQYCWCVAGSVGAMMCHVMGVRRERALLHGAHLGMAMQLTNICRDVAEDWQRGRLYLPTELAPELEAVRSLPQIPERCVLACARAVRRLLAEAETLYRSGDAGLPLLAFRSRLAVATARGVYSAIGERILAQDADVRAGRAFVSEPRKMWHVAGAAATALRLAACSSSQRRTGASERGACGAHQRRAEAGDGSARARLRRAEGRDVAGRRPRSHDCGTEADR